MMTELFKLLRLAANFGLLLLLALAPQLLDAQEDTTRVLRDSMRMRPPTGLNPMTSPATETVGLTTDTVPSLQLQVGNLHSYAFKDELHIPYHVDNSPLFRGDFSTGGVMWSHPSGAIIGSGSQETVPGIGRFNNASVGYMQMFGNRFTLSLNANAMKYNLYPSIGQEFSTSGRLSFQATDRLGFNAFGTKSLGGNFFMGDSYGGSVSLMMSDRFKMEVGVQRSFNPLTQQWETVPIAIPSLRLNNGAEIGVDVGSIIYEIFRSASFKNDRANGNPTIAPPRLNMPMK